MRTNAISSPLHDFRVDKFDADSGASHRAAFATALRTPIQRGS